MLGQTGQLDWKRDSFRRSNWVELNQSLMSSVLPCCKHYVLTATAWDHVISFCMHGAVGCISLAGNTETFVISLPYMVAFNATSQLWFYHLLIMYLIEFMQVAKFKFPFSSKSQKFFLITEKPLTIWNIIVHMFVAKNLKINHPRI